MITIEEIKNVQQTLSRFENELRNEHRGLMSDNVDEKQAVEERVSLAKMLHTASKASRCLCNLRLSAEWFYGHVLPERDSNNSNNSNNKIGFNK